MQKAESFGFHDLETGVINVDYSYQRPPAPRKVAALVKGLDMHAFGTLTVGMRSDGTHWCVDGQTRLEAARQLDFHTVPCVVFKSRGASHEASVFQLLNDQRSVSRAQKFFAQLCAGDERAHAITEDVENLGFKLSFDNTGGWPHIRAIACIETLADNGVLKPTLSTVDAVWGAHKDPEALGQSLLGGLGLFYARYGDQVDDKVFRSKLMKFMPPQLYGMGKQTVASESGIKHGICSAMVVIYNRGKRTRRITE